LPPPLVPKRNKTVNKPYRKIQVNDKLPIVENTQFYDYKALLKDYESEHGKPLEPINRRRYILLPSLTS